MSVQEVYPRVKNIITDVLMVEDDEVELNKRLIADLDAESIDFLDLIFQLEREFDIKIPRGQIEQEARGTLSDAEFEQNGVLTPAGLQALREYLPEVADEHFKETMKVNEIPTLFTVETLCNLVIRAQQRSAAA